MILFLLFIFICLATMKFLDIWVTYRIKSAPSDYGGHVDILDKAHPYDQDKDYG